MAMAHKRTAIAVFSSMIAVSYGLAQLSWVLYSKKTVALSQTNPVNGRIYFANGDMRSGEPGDINASSTGEDESTVVFISHCGQETATDNYLRRRYLRDCNLLREVDPRLYRLAYSRDVAEPTVAAPDRK
jgi:hypothetical protein